jgi:mRNA-degrading endonuclease toxin of MazEF toxin-antitoxin module
VKRILLFCLPLISAILFIVTPAHAQEKAQGCIVDVETKQEYCLPVGERSGYSLPEFIYDKQVYVKAPQGVGVMLCDYDNLSYNRLATFTGDVSNDELKEVKAKNGEVLDFSHPHSMRVVESSEPLGCIVSLDEQDEYCLPVGKRSGYSLPKFIYDKPIYVQASEGTAVMLSDYDNLSYNRLATFTGTVSNDELKHVKAQNGECLDFSHPHSMRVVQRFPN